jgi:hypothetical protein
MKTYEEWKKDIKGLMDLVGCEECSEKDECSDWREGVMNKMMAMVIMMHVEMCDEMPSNLTSDIDGEQYDVKLEVKMLER